MTEIPVFPVNAWIQIAVVLAFIIFVVVVFRYVFSHFKDITLSIEQVTDKFLIALEKRDSAFDDRNSSIITALRENTKMLEDLINNFGSHDATMRQALEDMRVAKARTKRKTEPQKGVD